MLTIVTQFLSWYYLLFFLICGPNAAGWNWQRKQNKARYIRVLIGKSKGHGRMIVDKFHALNVVFVQLLNMFSKILLEFIPTCSTRKVTNSLRNLLLINGHSALEKLNIGAV